MVLQNKSVILPFSTEFFSNRDKNIGMLEKPETSNKKELKTMQICTKMERRSKCKGQYISVVIEISRGRTVPRYPDTFVFYLPHHITVSQLVTIIREKLCLNPSNEIHLLLKDQRAIATMSQYLGTIFSKNDIKQGSLYFTLVAENVFGCPTPRTKPIRSKFPGNEPIPFDAPEPSSVFFSDAVLPPLDEDDYIPIDLVMLDLEAGQMVEEIGQVSQNISQVTQSLMPALIMEADFHFSQSGETGYFPSIPNFYAMLIFDINEVLSTLTLMGRFIIASTESPASQPPPILFNSNFHDLVVALDHLVPYSKIHPVTELNPSEELSGDSDGLSQFVPLVNSLRELVVACKNQIVHALPIPNHPGSYAEQYNSNPLIRSLNSTEHRLEYLRNFILDNTYTLTPFEYHILNFYFTGVNTLILYLNSVVRYLQNNSNVLNFDWEALNPGAASMLDLVPLTSPAMHELPLVHAWPNVLHPIFLGAEEEIETAEHNG